MNWYPRTETPYTRGLTAVIAILDVDGETYLAPGLHEWDGDEWIHQDSGEPLTTLSGVYWWLSEDDLLATLPETGDVG